MDKLPKFAYWRSLKRTVLLIVLTTLSLIDLTLLPHDFGAAAIPVLSQVHSVHAQAALQETDAQSVASSGAYEFTVVAKTGQADLTGFGSGAGEEFVSINDVGTVAFIGRSDNDKQAVYVGNGSADPELISLAPDSIRTYGPGLAIDNLGQVTVIDKDIYAGVNRTQLRRWAPGIQGAIPLVSGKATVTEDECPTAFPNACPYQYSNLYGYLTVNNRGQIAFMAQELRNPTRRFLVTYAPIKEYPYDVAQSPRPAFADDGYLVFRNDNNSSQSIVRRKADLSDTSILASAPNFSDLGLSPGVSDDGQIVVFYGELTEIGAFAYTLTAGSGIFASINTESGRVVQRIASPADFESFEVDDRVAVNCTHSSRCPPYHSGDTTQRAVTITYIATNKKGVKGIYTSRLNFFGTNLSTFDPKQPRWFTVSPPTPVVKVGQEIIDQDGIAHIVQKLAVYDPINNRDRGDIAFWAKTTNGEVIVRARPQQLVFLDFAPFFDKFNDPVSFDLFASLGFTATPDADNVGWYGTLAEVIVDLGKNQRPDLASATTTIQSRIVEQVQARFNDLNDDLGVNVKVVTAEPQDEPFIHVFIGDGPHGGGQSTSTTYGIAPQRDLFNHHALFSRNVGKYVYVKKSILIFVDNILRGGYKDPSGNLVQLSDTGPFQITINNLVDGISRIIAHEIGHAFGLQHLDTDLNNRIMNACVEGEELRLQNSFGNFAEQLNQGNYKYCRDEVYQENALENSGARLAFAAGSNKETSDLKRDPPSAAVLTETDLKNYKMLASGSSGVAAASGSETVARAILGIVPFGSDHAMPELVDLGSGNLLTLLNRKIDVGEGDQIFLIASTDGNGVDILGVTDGLSSDLETIELTNALSILTEKRLRGDLFDEFGKPVAAALDLFQITNSGLVRIGSVGAADMPLLQASPEDLHFIAEQGGTNPTNLSLTVQNQGAGTLGWTANETLTWLTLSSISGTAPSSIEVAVDINGLTTGTYTGTISITNTSAQQSPEVVNVILTVNMLGSGSLPVQTSPSALNFTAKQGDNSPATQPLTLNHTGATSLTWTATLSPTWLHLSQTSGATPATLDVSVDIAGLAAGTYQGEIRIMGEGQANSLIVPVTLVVNPAGGNSLLQVDATALTYNATVGNGNPAVQMLAITSNGSPTWRAIPSISWITLSAAEGAGSNNVQVGADITNLAPGIHTGQITILSEVLTEPIVINVRLTLGTSALQISPPTLAFTAVAGGGNPAAQRFTIKSNAALTWTASEEASWLSLSPTGGTAPSTVDVAVASSDLTVGTYRGDILVNSTEAGSQTIPLTLSVTPGNGDSLLRVYLPVVTR